MRFRTNDDATAKVHTGGARVLVVEDERVIADGIRFNLEREGYAVTVAHDGPAALAGYESDDRPFDAIVLDLMLPGMSGYDVCRAVRERDRDVPVLMLTARGLTEDKVAGFESGADQYLTKPFDLTELLARVRAMLARSAAARDRPREPAPPPEVLRFDGVTVDFASFRLTTDRGGRTRTHDLTTQEAALLRLFAQCEGRVLSRTEILEEVWPPDADVTPRTIDNFVLRLRRMIEPNPSDPVHLLSVRGTGYRFERDAG